MHKYIISGIQGCGKGTQARMLCEKFDFVHISVGDMFRWNIQNHTKLGARAKEHLDQGLLVTDELVEEVVGHRLQMHDWNYGFILDGFPRNHRQALFFLESFNINALIHILLPDKEIEHRVLNRRLCSNCGVDYNLMFHRPQKPNRCDICGGTLTKRPDDEPEQLERRLNDYRHKTEPVLKLFRDKNLLLEVDGARAKEEVHAEICAKLGLR